MNFDKLASFHFKCRYSDNVLVADTALEKVKKDFSEKNFFKLEVLEKENILAYVGVEKSEMGEKIHFDYILDHPDSESWVLAKIAEIVEGGDNVFTEVYSKYKRVIDLFDDKGFRLRRILTVTPYDQMVSGFKANFSNESTLPKGLIVKKLTVDEIEKAVSLLKDEFTKNPQHGPSNEAFVSNFREMLVDDLKKDHCQYGIFDVENNFIGHFAAFLDDDLIWRKVVGFHFMLHESIQRKKLLSYMYSVLFEDLEKFNVNVITGSTTHLAVVKNFQKLNRKPFLYSFNKNENLYEINNFREFLEL